MSLSLEERISGIYNSANTIIDELKNTKINFFKKIRNKIWPLIIDDTCSSFWLFGSDMDSTSFKNSSLVSIAFKSSYQSFFSENNDNDDNDEIDSFFNSYKIIFYMTQMESFLENSQDRLILKIYLLSLQLSYFINRYNDNIKKKYKDLNALIKNIQGFCFNLFKTKPVFLNAWLMHNIFRKVFQCNKDDLVNLWIVKHCLHHYFKFTNQKLEEIFKLFTAIQFKSLTLLERINIIIYFTRNFTYCKTVYSSLIVMIKKHNDENENKIDLEELENSISQIQEDKNNQYQLEKFCTLTMNYENPTSLENEKEIDYANLFLKNFFQK